MAYVKLKIIKRSKCVKHGDVIIVTNDQTHTFCILCHDEDVEMLCFE